MSKVNISLDTETNEMNLTIDGQSIPNVQSVTVYKYSEYENGKLEEEVSLSIQVLEEMPGDMVKHSYIIKSQENDSKIKFTSKSSLNSVIEHFVNKGN